MTSKYLLIIVLFLGAFLRFWGLSQAPVSLNWDEVSHGYNAYSVLKTAKDEWGTFLPSIFPGFGDYKLPGYIYFSVLPISVFGLNAFAVRFVSATSGVLAILGIYLLTNAIFSLLKLKNQFHSFNAGHVSALILSLLPWHIFLSRPALEANLALTLTIFGLYFLTISDEKRTNLIYASLFFSVSMHTYNSYRIFVPLVLLSYLVFFAKKLPLKSKEFFVALSIGLVSVFVIFFQLKSGDALARYEKLKILSPNAVYQIGEKRILSTLPISISRLVYNRPVFFTTQVIKNYLSYFTPQFINQSRGAQYQFAIPGQSLLGYPVLILVLFGIWFAFSHTSILSKFLLAIFFCSPLAAALTMDPPQAIRPSTWLVTIPIFAVFGLDLVLSYSKKYSKTLLVIIILSIVCSSNLFLYRYWTSYLAKYSQSWQYGYKEVFEYIESNKKDYSNIFVTKKYGEPHIFYAFYSKLNPLVLQNPSLSTRFTKSDWRWTDKIENIYFLNDWQIDTNAPVSSFVLESGTSVSTANSLLATSPEHVPQNSTVLKVVSFLDGSPAFIIVSIP